MPECPHCFSKTGEPHLPSCPIVNDEPKNQMLALPRGTQLYRGRYVIGMMLNQGGFGITYVARDNKHQRRVVIKEFFPRSYSTRNITKSDDVSFGGISGDSFRMLQAQFQREFEIMRKASSPGIPRVHTFFPQNNTAYYAMDLIEGITFRKYLMNQNSPLPWWYLRRQFFYPLLDTVASFHRKLILHRDISLVNLMITPKMEIVLLDFGASRDFSQPDTVEHLRFANKSYAPIEQTHPEMGFTQGPWTDIFALGTVFYTAITKHYPPDAQQRPEKPVESARNYIPDLPEPIDKAIRKALKYEPADRFSKVEDFFAALSEYPDPPYSYIRQFNFGRQSNEAPAMGFMDKLRSKFRNN